MIVFFVILAAVTAAQAVFSNEFEKNRFFRSRRSSSDKSVETEDHPFHVSILHWGNHNCGGVIISARHVLTAKSCVKDPAKEYMVLLSGASRTNSDGDLRLVSNVTLHDDLAVLRVEKPFDFNAKTKTIELLGDDENVTTYANATFIGYIKTGDMFLETDKLHAVTLEIYNKSYCVQTLQNFTIARQFCAGSDKKNIQGTDIGGPLIVKTKKNKILLAGIAVDIFKDHSSEKFGSLFAFSDITNSHDWILNNSKF